jgi:general secretion pathway protein G
MTIGSGTMRRVGPAGFVRRVMLTGSPGFTLIEMLVVLVIIGLVMGLVGPQVLNYLSDARAKAARLQIEAFGSALDLYYLDTGRYPPASDGLNALVRRPSGAEVWNGPYLKGGAVPMDPWGRTYVYRAPAERAPYEIISLGADGHEGGTGSGSDIRSGASSLR